MRREVPILIPYIVTMFVGATLLFLVQPMFARMVLPLLGGAPGVWNTTVVFYQAVLLAGYAYAHFTTTRLGPRRQALWHALLLLVPLLALPIGIPGGWSPPAEANPIPWLLGLLVVAVGLPFFVVSASGPMLQAWFAHTNHRAAVDPYFLSVAGNAGSMLALLSYPIMVEPRLRLAEQSWLWAGGYALLVILTLCCAAIMRRMPAPGRSGAGVTTEAGAPPAVASAPAGPALTVRRRARWVLLAFVPSSLMLSVTTYFSVNIAPFPLLWVIPLAIYLLTFILVFTRRPLLPHKLMVRALPIVLIPLVLTMVAGAVGPIWLLGPLHLLVFFLIAMVCHGAFAADRPAPARLTEFYLWMSVGGVLGGLFNSLLAPLLFPTVVEYPLVLILACALLTRFDPDSLPPPRRWLDLALPLVLGTLTVALALGLPAAGVPGGSLRLLLTFGVPALICFGFSRRPVRFALGIGVLFLASVPYAGDGGRLLHAERSFFGIHRVTVDEAARFHQLAHGNTIHGMQSLDVDRQREALTYYHATGPLGQLFTGRASERTVGRVAVVGLGAGTVACYSRPNQAWTFYEIDPSVERIARDDRFFTYLRDCAPAAQVVLGDARLSLAKAPDQGYDLMVLDAYSSDSVPVHLLTREALALYLRKLAPGGVLAFHISNNFLDLQAVVGDLAADAGLVGLVRHDIAVGADDQARGKTPSQWVVVARDAAQVGDLAADRRWQSLGGRQDRPVWTDDFSSVVSVLRWR